MGMRSRILTGLLAGTISLSGGAAFAQDAASPEASPATDSNTVELLNPEGEIVATATLMQSDTGVNITVQGAADSGLEPGEHGIHIHETGVCSVEGETPFDSAGDHFNPTDASHGAPDEESHAGDLGNLTVEDDGSFGFEITTDQVTLEPDAGNSLMGPEGTALLIHAGADDLESDPSGESGDRVACGIISPAMDAGATPEATPSS